jgi:hypothetical protein
LLTRATEEHLRPEVRSERRSNNDEFRVGNLSVCGRRFSPWILFPMDEAEAEPTLAPRTTPEQTPVNALLPCRRFLLHSKASQRCQLRMLLPGLRLRLQARSHKSTLGNTCNLRKEAITHAFHWNNAGMAGLGLRISSRTLYQSCYRDSQGTRYESGTCVQQANGRAN